MWRGSPSIGTSVIQLIEKTLHGLYEEIQKRLIQTQFQCLVMAGRKFSLLSVLGQNLEILSNALGT